MKKPIIESLIAMKNKLQWTGIERILEEDDHLYIKNETIHGSFDIALMEIKIYVSNEELEKIEKGLDLWSSSTNKNNFSLEEKELLDYSWRYMQTYNHELCHFYQVLSFPTARMRHILKKRSLQFESATMLRYFEQGGSYIIGVDKRALMAINKDNFSIPNNELENLKQLEQQCISHEKEWYSEFRGISLFQIVESMAHILSIQLSEEQCNYVPELENEPLYNTPYNLFLKNIDQEGLNDRWKFLLFIYICFFSCQTLNHSNDGDHVLPSKIFHTLISRADLYLNALTTLIKRYERYSRDELIQLIRFGITKEDLAEATTGQIASIYGFFELIPCIQQDSEKLCIEEKNVNDQFIDSICSFFNDNGFDISDYNLLAHLAIFPYKYGNFSDVYKKLIDSNKQDTRFTIGNEIYFYRFTRNCNSLLNRRFPAIECCEKHGSVVGHEKILSCTSEEGLASILEKLTGKTAAELFKE
ncbi:hypothetical protein [Motiliproteus sp. MSK22-1]|uniref:hypothetical protein n=1 Tax=Motiliproteus sp. MSK22-1 TaxID=1897630 RepID=UPI00117DF3BC|nr:hypothetical protein [Motiliproteus sp. MSK22-1]